MPSRFLPLLLLAACASGPVPVGPKPIWVQAPGSDLRFPPDKFICAAGTTSVGKKLAPELLAASDAAAREAVAARLRDSLAADEGGAERAARIAKDFDLTAAVEVLEKWREGDTAYAWGVLDKSKALAVQEAKVAEREKAAKDLIAQGEAAEAAGAPTDALRDYARSRTEAEAALGGAALLRVLGGKPAASNANAAADAKISTLLEKLVLTVVEGDKQRAAESKPLPQPVVFTAWMAGKKAGGLPFAVMVPGGRAQEATVSAEGRAEAQVEDIGKFAAAEQEIKITLDWARLLGAPAAPAWAPKIALTATALKKAVDTTRVLVLIYEKGEGAVTDAPVSTAVAGALRQAGFSVQDSKPIVAKFGAERLARLSDAQVKEAAKGRADMVVIGTVTSHLDSKSGETRARAEVRAVDAASGQIVFRSPPDEAALDAVSKSLAPGVEKALEKAVTGP